MTLDGWSLDKKITALRDEITTDMRELKIQFAMLYEYLKQSESIEDQETKKKKAKKKVLKD